MTGPGRKRFMAEKLADPKTPPAYLAQISGAMDRIAEAEAQAVITVPPSVESWMQSLIVAEAREAGICPDCRGRVAEPPACRALHGPGAVATVAIPAAPPLAVTVPSRPEPIESLEETLARQRRDVPKIDIPKENPTNGKTPQ